MRAWTGWVWLGLPVLTGSPAPKVLPVLLVLRGPLVNLGSLVLRVLTVPRDRLAHPVKPAPLDLPARTVLTGAGSQTRNAVTMAAGLSLGLTAPQQTADHAAHPHPSQELDHDDMAC